MSDPKHRPRDLAVHPRTFGRGGPIDWLADAPWALVVSARLQHDLAGKTATFIRETDLTAASFGKRMGWSTDRVGRLLRGEQSMRLEDVTALVAILGCEIQIGKRG